MTIKNNKVRGIGKSYLFIFITIFIISFSFVSAELGIYDSSKPKLQAPVSNVVQSTVNYSLVDTNNSIYWNGRAFVFGAVSSIEADTIWNANSSNVPRLNSINNFTQPNNFFAHGGATQTVVQNSSTGTWANYQFTGTQTGIGMDLLNIWNDTSKKWSIGWQQDNAGTPNIFRIYDWSANTNAFIIYPASGTNANATQVKGALIAGGYGSFTGNDATSVLQVKGTSGAGRLLLNPQSTGTVLFYDYVNGGPTAGIYPYNGSLGFTQKTSLPAASTLNGGLSRNATGLFASDNANWIRINTLIPRYTNVSVTSLINLELTTIPACGASTNGSIARNDTGIYGCNNTGSWVRIF